MIEAGVLIDTQENPMYWHLPPGRTGATLPDSRDLWDVIWENRHQLVGFAHTHPGVGRPWPSTSDLTTFIAIENALGRRLLWWIATMDKLAIVHVQRWRSMTDPSLFSVQTLAWEPSWVETLRRYSEGDMQ